LYSDNGIFQIKKETFFSPSKNECYNYYLLILVMSLTFNSWKVIVMVTGYSQQVE